MQPEINNVRVRWVGIVAEWANGEEDKSAARLFHQICEFATNSDHRRHLRLRHHPVHGRQHAGAWLPTAAVDGSMDGNSSVAAPALARMAGLLVQLRRT